ncbi:PAAR domain-containing protein [Tateyamaria sp. ANG-S1]|uniref:PAAR domain-containing protein n=1 Tax=Tateyamaria sp. ANG-S1 TaxID=1577905 RepID=UPI00316ADE9E
MPATPRKSDSCSGHSCFPSSPAFGGSPNVAINCIPALRQGDTVAPRGCGKCKPHGRSVFGGSPTVYVNGCPLARIGDGMNAARRRGLVVVRRCRSRPGPPSLGKHCACP